MTAFVWLAVACEVAAVLLLARGSVRGGRRWLLAGAASAAVAVTGLGWALVTNDFTLAYVADHSTRAAAAPYRLAGLWGGMEGSLLLWVALLAALAVAGTTLAARCLPAEAATAGAALAGVTVLFAVPLLFVARPFDRLAMPALDGGGLSPVLEHPAMLYHPPLLYLGYAGLVVPFALALAALRSGRLGRGWLETTRAASLASWGVLTAGLASGAHWAYLELGWGGFWAWDPVENAALVPWLVTTAFLHAASLDRRRGRASTATAALPVVAFVLAAFGALLTRSGAAVSVHAFAEARAVGWLLLGTCLIIAGAGAAAVARDRRRFAGGGTETAGAGAGVRPDPSAVTVRRLVGAGNAGLLAMATVVLLGTALPVAEGLLRSSPRVVDARYFVLFCGPIAAGIVVALLAAEAVSIRSPRARGRSAPAALAHLGIVLVCVGVAGSALGTSKRLVLGAGETGRVGGAAGTRITLERFASKTTARATELQAMVAVGAGRGGTTRVVVELHQRTQGGVPQSEAAVVSTARADVLVVPRRIDVANGMAVLEVHRRPLVLWIWVGAGLLVIGSALGVGRHLTGASARGAGRSSPAPAPAAGPSPVPKPDPPAPPHPEPAPLPLVPGRRG